MNRSTVERELKRVGVILNGWMPVLQCDACKRRWEPFQYLGEESAPTVRLDYWRCPNGCNSLLEASDALKNCNSQVCRGERTIRGMIFGDEDLPDFERYVGFYGHDGSRKSKRLVIFAITNSQSADYADSTEQ
jgi:hypothetical protein